MTFAAAVAAAIAAWVTFGAIAVTGPRPFTARVGVLPNWGVLAGFLAIAIAMAVTASYRNPRLPAVAVGEGGRRTSAFALLTSYLFLLLLPWLPFPVPRAFLVWTGPVAAAVWAGLAAAVVLARSWRWRTRLPVLTDPRRAPWIASVAGAVFFGFIAVAAAPMSPGGDEPHYLIITQSLLRDGDLKIENNHTRGDYKEYFGAPLRPDFLVRGRDNEIYSIHAPGLPALIAPAFALGGYRAVMLFMIAVAAAGIGLLWKLAHDASGDAGAAWFGTLAIATATPVAFISFTIYPDSTAWVLALTGVHALMRLERGRWDTRPGRWFLHGLALALLPWLHSRFAFLAGLFGLFVLLRLPRTRDGVRAAGAFLAPAIVGAALWFWSFYAIYGTPDPQAPYGTLGRTHAAWSFVPEGLLGLLFDQQFGLLLYAPVFFVVFGGWIGVLGRATSMSHRRLAIELAILAAPYLTAVTYLRMWWGGWSVPVRFAVPVLAFGGLFAAIAWTRMTARGTRAVAVAALLVSAFTTAVLAVVQRGRLAYNVRDGVSLWLEWLSRLADLPSGFPSFFRGTVGELVLHSAVWLVLLIAAWLVLRWLGRTGLTGRAALAAATGVAFAIAAMVSLTIVWRLEAAPAMTAPPAQLALLRAADAGRRVGLRLSPPAVTTADAILPLLRLASPERALGGRDRPALALPGWIPAGRYDLLGAHDGPLQLRIVRVDEPILTLQAHETAIRLPVAVPALVLTGPAGPDGLVLQPARVVPLFDDRPRARRARRYSSAVVFFLDDDALAEPEAFWIRGRADTEIVLQLDAEAAQAPMFVRNGPMENRLRVSTGEWRDERPLAPGEERELLIPLDTARGATRLRLESASGFRPSDVYPGSADARYLGIWVQFRTGPPR